MGAEVQGQQSVDQVNVNSEQLTPEEIAENKAKELKKMMNDALEDGTVDAEELMKVQDKFNQDDLALSKGKAESIHDTIKECKSFQEKASVELFTKGVTIDKATMSEDRFDNIIHHANLNCNLEEGCIVNYREQSDKFTVKLVDGKFEVEEVIVTPLEQLQAIVDNIKLNEGHSVDIQNGVFTVYNERDSKLGWFDIDNHLDNPVLSTDGKYDQDKIQGWYKGKIGKFKENVKANKQVDKQTDKQVDKQTDKQVDKQTDKQTDKQVDKQTDKQEVQDIKSLEDLKASLSDEKKNVVLIEGNYYFVDKDFSKNSEIDLQKLRDGETGQSLEDILKTIDQIEGVELGFDVSMSEEQKLSLIMGVIDRKFKFEDSKGKEVTGIGEYDTLFTDEIVKDTIYTKEKFENTVTEELNNLIEDATVKFESGEHDLRDLLGNTTINFNNGEVELTNSIDPLAKSKLEEIVNQVMKKYGNIQNIQLTFNTDDKEIINIYTDKEQNIFESLNIDHEIIFSNGLFTDVPELVHIDDNKVYKIVKKDKVEDKLTVVDSVVLSGSKLKELLVSNDKNVSESMEDNRKEIDINKDKLGLEELGISEEDLAAKDIDFDGKSDKGEYLFDIDGRNDLLLSVDKKTIVDEDAKLPSISIEGSDLVSSLGIIETVLSNMRKMNKVLKKHKNNLEPKHEDIKVALATLDKVTNIDELKAFNSDLVDASKGKGENVAKAQEKANQEYLDAGVKEQREDKQEEMEELLLETKFDTSDVLGESVQRCCDQDKINWLKTFSKKGAPKYIELDDVEVDLVNNKINFSFDDRGFFNEDFNENLSVDIKQMLDENGNLKIEDFTKALPEQVNIAIQKMKEDK